MSIYPYDVPPTSVRSLGYVPPTSELLLGRAHLKYVAHLEISPPTSAVHPERYPSERIYGCIYKIRP